MPVPSAEQLSDAWLALVRALGVEAPGGATQERLIAYAQLVATWNQRIDLTAAKKPSELIEVLFADALMLADPQLVPAGARIVDVGSGVGAPIIPLVLLRQDVSARAVEPRRKRVAFLRTVVGQLELVERLAIVEGRVELDAPADPAQMPADIACSRATFAPPDWLPLGLRLAARAIVLAARDGLPQAPRDARLLAERSYALPSSGARRVLGVYARE